MSDAALQEAGILRRWLVSLAFWLALLVATLLFAAVSLAPKLVAYADLRAAHYQNQVELVALEREVNHLEKVADALKHDPEFAAELARIDFDAIRPGEERIAVDRCLKLETTAQQPLPARQPDYLDDWLPQLRILAGDRIMRAQTLAAAAAIVLVAFTFFHTGSPVRRPAVRRRWRWLDRYRKRPPA